MKSILSSYDKIRKVNYKLSNVLSFKTVILAILMTLLAIIVISLPIGLIISSLFLFNHLKFFLLTLIAFLMVFAVFCYYFLYYKIVKALEPRAKDIKDAIKALPIELLDNELKELKIELSSLLLNYYRVKTALNSE